MLIFNIFILYICWESKFYFFCGVLSWDRPTEDVCPPTFSLVGFTVCSTGGKPRGAQVKWETKEQWHIWMPASIKSEADICPSLSSILPFFFMLSWLWFVYLSLKVPLTFSARQALTIRVTNNLQPLLQTLSFLSR